MNSPFFVSRRSVLVALGALPTVCLMTRARARGSGEYADFDPGPNGKLRVSRPVISWRVLPGTDTRVTGASLKINGQSVSAAYLPDKKAVWYEPGTPLAPGPYTVECGVQFDGEAWVNRTWKFAVTPNAAAAPATPTDSQKNAIDTANALRARVGLPALVPDARLCAAAQNQCVYVARHGNQITHEQTDASSPVYLARDSSGRAGAFGYAGGCFEAIGQGVTEGKGVVRRLFDAPYHRAPFVQPGVYEVGAGVMGDVVTLVFGSGAQPGIATYPANNQKDVPLSWDGIESPNPLRMHPEASEAEGKIGYVVTLNVFPGLEGTGAERLAGVSARLYTMDNKAVPAWVNTPDNDDHLDNGVILIPKAPLRPSTTYRARVTARDDGRGNILNHEWTFTTTARPFNTRDVLRPGDPLPAEFVPVAQPNRAVRHRIGEGSAPVTPP